MRTNIDIDDELMASALKAGPFKTKKDAVEAGLRLLARQAAYREILRWEGKLKWEGDDEPEPAPAPSTVLRTGGSAPATMLTAQAPTQAPVRKRRHAGR